MKKVIAVVVVSVMLTACTGVGNEDVTETTVHVCETCESCSGEDEPNVTETVVTTISEPVEVTEPVETTVTREVSPEELIEAFNDGVRAQEVAFKALKLYMKRDYEALRKLMVTEEEAEFYLSGYRTDKYEEFMEDLIWWEECKLIVWEETDGWEELSEVDKRRKSGRIYEDVESVWLIPMNPMGYTVEDGYAIFGYEFEYGGVVGDYLQVIRRMAVSAVRTEQGWKVYEVKLAMY
ncbi:MAG: hypothetical protein FWD34_10775 [Oscillospiraceae bacterium]|nr:hypothetical protein [Oscillospiraceae bacterium]